MATGDWPPYTWPTGNAITGGCNHGTPYGTICFYCLHPAIGPAAPQTFQMAGWTCPGCLRCYSPALTCCPICPQQTPAGISEDHGECVPQAEGGLCDHGDEDDIGKPPCLSSECDC